MGEQMCGKCACMCGKVVRGPGLRWHAPPYPWLQRVPEMPSDGPQGGCRGDNEAQVRHFTA